MKIIKTNSLVSVTASSTNPSYPVSNLYSNTSPKKKWKAANAAVTMASFSVAVAPGSDGIGMTGIVAESATVKISNPSGITWGNVTWGNVSWDPGTPDVVIDSTYIQEQGRDFASLWASFPQFDSIVNITIELRKSTGNPNVLAAGVLVAGEMVSFPDPFAPLAEGINDYSITRELSNGAFYHRERDRVRTFAGEIGMDRAQYFYQFMRDFARTYGQTPVMALIAEGMGDEFIIYGRLAGMPSGSHINRNRSAISFNLIEVI